MQVIGTIQEDVEAAVKRVSDSLYDGNVYAKFGTPPRVRMPSCSFTLWVKDSHGRGAKRGRDGKRHTTAACWHAHTDVLLQFFCSHPTCRVITKLADYRGREDYGRKAPSTGDINQGSVVAPFRYRDMCDCGK